MIKEQQTTIDFRSSSVLLGPSLASLGEVNVYNFHYVDVVPDVKKTICSKVGKKSTIILGR